VTDFYDPLRDLIAQIEEARAERDRYRRQIDELKVERDRYRAALRDIATPNLSDEDDDAFANRAVRTAALALDPGLERRSR